MKIDSVDLIRKLPAMIQGNKKFAKIDDGGNYHIGEVDKWCLRFDEVVKAIEDYCDYKETGKYKLTAPVNGSWNVLNAYKYREAESADMRGDAEAFGMATEALEEKYPCGLCKYYEDKEDWGVCQYCPAEPKGSDTE